MVSVNDASPEDHLAAFIDKYTPGIAAKAHAILRAMRTHLPGAVELVYDNYNALVIGFGPTERASDAIFSVAVYPRWVSLVFLHGAGLHDPHNLLKGGGTRVRHIVLEGPQTLDTPSVRALMTDALIHAPRPLDRKQHHRIVVKSISAKQRPRRPARKR